MAFALKGAGGTVNSSAANQSSLALTTATTAGAVGDLAVIRYAVDNFQTTDGDEGAVTGIVDSTGSNVWIEAAEFTNGQGAAQAGATCGIWYCNLTAALPVGSTVTLSFSNNTSRDVSAAALEFFTKAAGFNAAVEGTPGTLANDGAAAGSLNVTTANIACLRIRAIASESSTATVLTKTAAFTAVLSQALTTGGGTATNIAVRGEYLVSTATGQASAPTAGAGAVDNASVYVAFREDAVPVAPSGWASGNGSMIKAAVAVWPALLLATQATQFAAPPAAENTVTIDKWQQPLSVAPKVARAIQGDFEVPFNTPQVAPQVAPRGWASQNSGAPRTAKAAPTQATGFQSPAPPTDNNVTSKAWHQPLSTAPRRAVVVNGSGLTFVVRPFAVADNNVTAKAWHQPLSVAVAAARAKPGEFEVPFNTPQAVTPVPLVYDAATPRDQVVYYQAHIRPPAYVPQVADNNAPTGWVRQFSTAPQTAKAVYTQPTFAGPPAEVPKGWYRPLSVAAKSASVVYSQPIYAAPPPVAAPADASLGWLQPLSGAPATASARQGSTFVPFDTAQINTQTVDKWLQPLSRAPVVQRQLASVQPFFAYTAPAAPDNTVTVDKWQQPLSVAVPVAKARPGLAVTPLGVVRPVTGVAWAQPLSVPVKVAKAAKTQPLFVSVKFDIPRGWFAPLSVAVKAKQPRQPSSVVYAAYEPAPVAPIAVSGMAWFRPLDTLPPVVRYPTFAEYLFWPANRISVFIPPDGETPDERIVYPASEYRVAFVGSETRLVLVQSEYRSVVATWTGERSATPEG